MLAGAGAVTATLLVLAPAAGVLAAGVLTAGVAVPWLAAVAARRAAARTAPARGALSAAVADALGGMAELHVFGAAGAARERAEAADAELSRLARGAAAASGLGTGLMALASGATLWAVLLLGVAVTGDGRLGRVPLAVLTLTALAAFEAVNGLPAAAIQLGQSAAAARRTVAVLDAPDPVPDPARPAPLPGGPVRSRCAERRWPTSPAGRWPWAASTWTWPPAGGWRCSGRPGAGKSTVAAVLLKFASLTGGTVSFNECDFSLLSGDAVRSAVCGLAQDAHVFDATIRANLLIGRPGAGEPELAGAAARAGLLDWIRSLPGLGYADRAARRPAVGRAAAAAGPGPGAAGRPGGADPGRADGAPGPTRPRCPGRRPAGGQRGPQHAAHHP